MSLMIKIHALIRERPEDVLHLIGQAVFKSTLSLESDF
mgnify:CR=1 FL=1